MKTILAFAFLVAVSVSSALGQNTNSSTTRPPAKAPAPPPPTVSAPKTQVSTPKPEPKKPAAVPQPTGAEAVNAAFNDLINGIRHANVGEVTGVYWNAPQLSLFNFNGSVTKGWDQVKKNRESSYPVIKDVKLDVRDKSITMLGRDGAVVTCQWTQSQVYKGTPETASGRMTLVFKRFGTAWKAIHLHSSPDSPNPASIPPSEQLPKSSPTPTPTP